MRDQRILTIFQAQRIDNPLAVGEIAWIITVLNPAVMDNRLAAARQIEDFATTTVLRIEVRQLNRGAVVPFALLLT